MKKNGLSLLLIFLFILLLLFPETTKYGAQEGLSLWYRSIVPILFPFIILSNIMVSTDSFSLFLKPFFLLKRFVPGLNPWYFYALILGFFCGYPMGAKAVADLVTTGKISISEGNRLLPIVNQASPMFLAGYLGIHIFEKNITFRQILFYIYFPPVLFFLYCLFVSASAKNKLSENSNPMARQKNSMSQSMEHTIWNSFFIIVTIGVYMMVFTILMRLSYIVLPPSMILRISSCFLEFSTGLHQLKYLNVPAPLKNSLILALTSFGGLCTAAQTYSIIGTTGISMKSYLCKKAFFALLVFLTAYSSFVSS